MQKFQKASVAWGGIVAVLLAASSAQGAVVVPGSVLFPAAAEPDPVGGVTVVSAAVPFAIAGSFFGTLTSTVIAGDASNPLGGLTFTYLISNNSPSVNSIGRMSVQGYFGFLTDGSYQVPAAGVAPATIDRGVSGDVIGFNFIPTPTDPLTGFLAPGASSAVLVIQTGASFFLPTIASVIDGGVATVPSFRPAVIPEPQTVALFVGIGVLGFGLWRRVTNYRTDPSGGSSRTLRK